MFRVPCHWTGERWGRRILQQRGDDIAAPRLPARPRWQTSLVLHEDRQRATSFGSDPELYHRVRPSYPSAMVDYLVQENPREVLDVGCGTGITSGLFADRGCQVVGVEIDERMAAFARSLGFEAQISGFEGWRPAGRSFDLVVSGQAWHWVDPTPGTEKAAEVLRSGGRIGLFWNRACHDDAEPPGVTSTAYDRVAIGVPRSFRLHPGRAFVERGPTRSRPLEHRLRTRVEQVGRQHQLGRG